MKLKRRGMGQEIELGLYGTKVRHMEDVGQGLVELILKSDVKAFLFSRQHSNLAPVRIYWLENGAKLHIDVGHHPEYAGPTCDNAKDIVAHDKAGESIVAGLMEEFNKKNGTDYAIIKNNVSYSEALDDKWDENFRRIETAWGLHENYQGLSSISVDKYSNLIIPHLVARTVYTGAGHIGQAIGRDAFILSSRSTFVRDCHSNCPQSGRPFILDRPESLADREKFHRLQVASGEANMLEVPIYLKFATTHLCFRLIEEGWVPPPGFEMVDPPNQLRHVATDIYCRYWLEMNCGFKTAIEIERIYLEAAKTLSDLTEEDRNALELWEEILDLLSRDLTADGNLLKLYGVLDWPTKWYIVKKRMEKDNLSIGDERILGINILYHSLDHSTRRSLWSRLLMADREKPFMRRIVSKSDVALATYEPCCGRDRTRADFIRIARALSHKMDLRELEWDHALLYLPKVRDAIKINFGDHPFCERSESFENFKRLL